MNVANDAKIDDNGTNSIGKALIQTITSALKSAEKKNSVVKIVFQQALN